MKKYPNIFAALKRNWITLSLVFFFVSCHKKKEELIVPKIPVSENNIAKLTVSFTNLTGTNPFVFNNYQYYTCDSTSIEFTSMLYIISGLQIEYVTGKIFTANLLKTTSINDLILDSIPYGTIKNIRFKLGVKSADVPAQQINDISSMYWPASMGGGYHYIKLEGHYKDTANVIRGFAFHAGGDNLAPANINFNCSLTVNKASHHLTINFNPIKLITTPYCYSFYHDPNYTMSSDTAMKKIMNNSIQAFLINTFE